MHEYLLALIGGILIGLAAVLLMLTQGKIMGVSGILSRLLPPHPSDWLWRVAFLSGLILTPVGYSLVTGAAPTIEITSNGWLIAGAGLLVGIGTVIGNGCTSGHGVCGLPRFSPRSVVATGTFMVVAAMTVFVVRHFFAG